jgi:SAM-dependent methyltransferase
MEKTVEVNRSFYESHWASHWKARFMYDPISKRNIARDCLRRAGAWPVGQRVLDIGFGFGLILFSLDRSNRIAGVELARSAVEFARVQASRCGFREAEFVHYSGAGLLPLPDASYDLIVCSHVLEHVPDDRFILREIGRLLAPGGRVFLNVPINEDHFEDPNHVRKYTVEGFRALLKELGFELRFEREADRLWDWFGWFFEKGYHDLPVIGFPLSSLINVAASSLPYGLASRLERVLTRARPRQFATLSSFSGVSAGRI